MSSSTPAAAPRPSPIPLTGTWFHRVGLAPYAYLGLYPQPDQVEGVATSGPTVDDASDGTQRSAA